MQLIREKSQPLNSVGTAELLDYVRNADEQHDVIINLLRRLQKQQNHGSISKNKVIQTKVVGSFTVNVFYWK